LSRAVGRQVVRGSGFGLLGDLLSGVGAFIGSLLFPRLGIHLGTGFISEIVFSALGAIIARYPIQQIVLRLIEQDFQQVVHIAAHEAVHLFDLDTVPGAAFVEHLADSVFRIELVAP
jgi:uncharacterized membrane protein YeaQ/YmgE (transglycosylase-associated protein family)